MEFRVTWLSTLSIVPAFLFLFATGPTADAIDPDSWDLVTTIVCTEISFFKNDINIRNSTIANMDWIYSLAYSGADRTLYMSGRSQYDSALTSCNLDEEDLIARPIPVCSDQDPVYSLIFELAFDPVTNTLFWLDESKGAILKMNIASDGSCNRMKVVVDGRGMSVQNIALDICNRFIYWAYYNDLGIKMGRARLDGTGSKEIVSGTEWPFASSLAVDNYAGKLYVAGHNSGKIFTIEESNLDGTDRRVLVNGTETWPQELAVDDTAVYWAQWDSEEIWKVYKNGTAKHVLTSHSIHIITRGNADCEMKAKSDGSLTLPGVDPMVILLPLT